MLDAANRPCDASCSASPRRTIKKAARWSRLQRGEREECFSGKAMQDDEVKALAWTLVREKSKILKEG
jgi:hypothetical protein